MRFLATPRNSAIRSRAMICAGLVFAYFGFVGEAIHCQYFVQEHHQHGTPASKPISHAAHCMAANHGTSATIHSAEVYSETPAQHFVFLLAPGETEHDPGVVLSKTARGPPAA